MRTFTLYRTAVAGGVTEGKDAVAYNQPDEVTLEGVIFSDGKTAVRWLTAKRSVVVWDSFEDFAAIHIGTHSDYGTLIRWGDGSEERL
jgi:hypothetical protein